MTDPHLLCNEYIIQSFQPFIKQKFPKCHRFWQGNDPKYTSKATKEWMKKNDLNHWPTPPESPDINLIKNV